MKFTIEREELNKYWNKKLGFFDFPPETLELEGELVENKVVKKLLKEESIDKTIEEVEKLDKNPPKQKPIEKLDTTTQQGSGGLSLQFEIRIIKDKVNQLIDKIND